MLQYKENLSHRCCVRMASLLAVRQLSRAFLSAARRRGASPVLRHGVVQRGWTRLQSCLHTRHARLATLTSAHVPAVLPRTALPQQKLATATESRGWSHEGKHQQTHSTTIGVALGIGLILCASNRGGQKG